MTQPMVEKNTFVPVEDIEVGFEGKEVESWRLNIVASERESRTTRILAATKMLTHYRAGALDFCWIIMDLLGRSSQLEEKPPQSFIRFPWPRYRSRTRRHLEPVIASGSFVIDWE